MKKRIVWEILFICFLGFSAWYLFGLLEHAKSNNHDLKRIDRNNNLMFMSGAGIGIMGNKVGSILLNSQGESEVFVAAFLLRYDSLSDDLTFWNEVGGDLTELDTVRLTAYCENARCIETLKENPDVAHFTILEYGAVTDMQAVINVDAGGEFWLRGNKRLIKIKWRDGTLTPVDIVNSIRQSVAWKNDEKNN